MMSKVDRPISKTEDYLQVREAISFITKQARKQPSLEEIARHVGLSPTGFHKLFVRWAGLTPKNFLQTLTLDHAKNLLDNEATILEASIDSGLSGSGRLHDLFVQYEAMSPGEYARKGEGLTMRYGFHDCPFGLALLVATTRGIAGLGFADGDDERDAALHDMMRRWPRANYVEDKNATKGEAERIFSTSKWSKDNPLRILLIGTDFELLVWKRLLHIPPGEGISYGELARSINKPAAHRAVGSAVGRNPISFVVPCHRVLRKGGGLGGYHWSLPRKQAIIGWEKHLP